MAPYRDLPGRRPDCQSEGFIAEGRLLVERLLASDYITESILVEQRRVAQWRHNVRPETPVFVAPRNVMRQIVGFKFHKGVVARGLRQPPWPLDRVLGRSGNELLAVVCVDIQDAENLGGILRNCAAFGVDAVVVSPHCVDPFSRRVLRVSMGAVLRLPIVMSAELGQDLRRLRNQWRCQLTAAVLDRRAIPLSAAERPDRQAILFGNEAHGLDPRWIDGCHRKLTIPMLGGTDSLNVAVASGIFLHHFRGSLAIQDP